MPNDKTKKALALLSEEFKKPPILFSKKPSFKGKVVDTGSLILNQLFTCGGWPRGRIIELFGKPSAGKTTLCYHAIAAAQKLGAVAFIDTEHRAEMDYAMSLGVDPDNLIFDAPSSGEEVFDKVVTMLKSKLFSLIVIDSAAHCKPESHADSDMKSANIGTHAKLMTKGLDRISKILGETCVLFTNQIRKDPSGYGSGEFTPGGEALKFDASLRVRLHNKTAEKDKEDKPTHNVVLAKVVKTSVGLPYKEAEFTIRFGEGVSICDDTLDAGILAGIIIKSGGNHSIIVHGKKETIGRSRDQALVWLSQKGRAEKIRQAIIKSKWYTGAEEGEQSDGEKAGDISRDGEDEAGEESVSTVPKMREYFLRKHDGAASPVREAKNSESRRDTERADEEGDDNEYELTL